MSTIIAGNTEIASDDDYSITERLM